MILEREGLSSLQDDVLPLLLESQFREDSDATAAANVAAMLAPEGAEVSLFYFILFTVTLFHANPAHNLTLPPLTYLHI